MKKMVCACHDITSDDIESAIELGYDDLESLKRFTGVTTGHCQGKRCMMLVLQILARKKKIDIEKTARIRPPIQPVPLESLVTQAR
jgi:bacterioferritin-associated ferredoxin